MGFPWLRELLGYNEAQQAGVGVVTRNKLNFLSGVTVTDNPSTGATDISIGGGEIVSRVWSVGQGIGQYANLAAAMTAVGAASPALSSSNRGMVFIYPGKYTSTAPIVTPASGYLTVKGFSRGSVQLQNDTTDLFQVGGSNVWFEDILVEGSPTVGLYAFDCNDKSACHFTRVDMFDNGGTARQFFLKQEGATWTVLKCEHCDVDYNGLTGFAWRIYNTSGAARIVDCWIEDCFSDAFALTSGGGNFDLSKLRDIRFWRSTVRGTNAPGAPTFLHTGIRVRNGGSTGITCEIANHYGCGAEGLSGGVGAFGDANTTIVLGGGVCRGAASSGALTNLGNLTYITQ